MDLLTFVTAGSVDDGKSTLIGRLLYDSDKLFEDQIEAVKKADKIDGELDFSLFTDGLTAEREQKITIDVAYRYFSTEKRRFIIADVPGHEQYTKNMATGASKAQAALILVDATKGLLPQTKRHLFIASLFRIDHLAIVINKMDAVDYSQDIFEDIRKQCLEFIEKLNLVDIQFIPVSSLKGDMVVRRGEKMLWYEGRTVLSYLENVEFSGSRNLIDFRFPVQYVIRPNQNERYYAGNIQSGVIRTGEEVIALPSGRKSKVNKIFVGDQERKIAFNPEAAAFSLTDHLDISKGEMIARVNNIPEKANYFNAMICWFSEESFDKSKRYGFKHTTNDTHCFVENIFYRLNIENLHRENADSLNFNEIGKVCLKTQKPIMFDPYVKNKNTGSFIIIDELTKNTVGAGVIIEKAEKNLEKNFQQNASKGQSGAILWLTGLSGSGKTTVAKKLAEKLQEFGLPYEHLDGDEFRKDLNIGLSFSESDRIKNIEIAGYVADKLAKHGIFVITSFISPYRSQREKMKERNPDFIEIFINASLENCIKRDIKGWYKKAQLGEVTDFTGISHPYEEPLNPDIVLQTDTTTVEECVDKVVEYLKNRGLLNV
ncbi:MAG TPA: adenylyl-sulfate kinase [Candidatus Magasanikbacteria bacterium]|nr:adenylyl-sulfate kinase [Candidatus Magasanikbacteria bacterium]